jgi:hypothetical protein
VYISLSAPKIRDESIDIGRVISYATSISAKSDHVKWLNSSGFRLTSSSIVNVEPDARAVAMSMNIFEYNEVISFSGSESLYLFAFGEL